MKLILTQKDIEEAVRNHVGNMLTMKEGTEMAISFTATRGEQGIVAEIDINYLGLARITEIAEATSAVVEPVVPEVDKPAPTRRTRRTNLFDNASAAAPADPSPEQAAAAVAAEDVQVLAKLADSPVEPTGDSLDEAVAGVDAGVAEATAAEEGTAAEEAAAPPADEKPRKSLFTGFMTR